MTMNDLALQWTPRLTALMQQSVGLSDPNPRVACMIQTLDGTRFEGHTQAAGSAHAEVHALQAARAAGAVLQGAHVWVTLEPCSHHGRTPPCCDALIEAGVGHVTVALQDPNPLVAGQGLARLRAAGIGVTLLQTDHLLAQASRAMNIGFLSRMQRRRPWVRLKMACSLDGTTALSNGESQWITSAQARHDGHAWRQRANAILTGVGTLIADDPRLTVRGWPVRQQPMRVVVDAQLSTPAQAQVLRSDAPVWIFTRQTERPAWTQAPHIQVHTTGHGTQGKVDLPALLTPLAQAGVNELHVEAGHKLAGSWVREGLVDEILIYMAPTLLGPGMGLLNLGPLSSLAQGVRLEWLETERIGPDLRLRLLSAQGAAFWSA